MKTITNNGRRRLGLPGRPALVLNPGQSVEVTDAQLEYMMANRTAARWISSGTIEVGSKEPKTVKKAEVKAEAEAEKDEATPAEKLTGEGFEIQHEGRGWYSVHVNGFKVTDSNVRKTDAEALRDEYE